MVSNYQQGGNNQQGGNYQITYNVDMVFCIDATGSMGGVIDMVKRNAVSFYGDLMFAPDAEYWNTISDNWDNTIHFPSEAGNGLSEIDYHQIIDAISNTI